MGKPSPREGNTTKMMRMKMEVVGRREEGYKGGEWHKGAEMDNYWMRGRRVRRREGEGIWA